MTFDEFKTSLALPAPPENLAPLLKALWHDGRGDWEAAHDIAQEVTSADGSWVHAYLHRKEGDPGNASYWYNRARRSFYTGTLADEWAGIVKALLD